MSVSCQQRTSATSRSDVVLLRAHSKQLLATRLESSPAPTLVCAFATSREHRRNWDCKVFVAAETFGLTIDVIRNGGKR